MNQKEIIYSKNVIEFVTVGVEYCLLLEHASEYKAAEFVDKSVKILPLLYLKATLLPECSPLSEDFVEEFVTEETYAHTANVISSLLHEKDDYLETFHPEMKFSDTPVLASISEDLADIYQDIKNFVSIFSIGHEISMNDALVTCKENFAAFWGQKLVNAMGALHQLRYNADETDQYEPTEEGEEGW
jgi:hypothetical protein